MSSAYDRNFLISFANRPNTKLKYVLEQREKGREVLFWLQIKSECLAAWRRQLLDRQTRVGRYIDLVNLNIPGNAFRLNPSSERLESRLYELGNLAEAKRKTLNKKGSPKQRKEFLASYKKVAVLAEEVINVNEWTSKIFKLEEELGLAKEEIDNWKQQFHDLEEEKQKLFQEMLKEKDKYQSGKEESELMRKYIRQLESDQFKTVRGTPIPEITTSQARNRKLKELKTRAQKALHFCTLFGLELDALRLKDPQSPQTYTVKLTAESRASTQNARSTNSASPDSNETANFSCPSSSPATPLHGTFPLSSPTSSSFSSATESPPTSLSGLQPQLTELSTQKETQYSKLSDDDKARVESILYLIDKFGVGDEFIHELTMTVEGLPKSYLFKQCRNELNESCIIKSTPGKAPGAQHSFSKLLAKHGMCKYCLISTSYQSCIKQTSQSPQKCLLEKNRKE